MILNSIFNSKYGFIRWNQVVDRVKNEIPDDKDYYIHAVEKCCQTTQHIHKEYLLPNIQESQDEPNSKETIFIPIKRRNANCEINHSVDDFR